MGVPDFLGFLQYLLSTGSYSTSHLLCTLTSFMRLHCSCWTVHQVAGYSLGVIFSQ